VTSGNRSQRLTLSEMIRLWPAAAVSRTTDQKVRGSNPFGRTATHLYACRGSWPAAEASAVLQLNRLASDVHGLGCLAVQWRKSRNFCPLKFRRIYDKRLVASHSHPQADSHPRDGQKARRAVRLRAVS